MLSIEKLSENQIIASTPPLKKMLFNNFRVATLIAVIGFSTVSGLFILLFIFVSNPNLISNFYSSSKTASNQGDLSELTCERLEAYIVNCKLEQTDLEGKKRTIFSASIKSATYSFVTHGYENTYYACSVSFVTRDGRKIGIEILSNNEIKKDCPITKATVKQINQYILGDGNKPLTWKKDTRTGDLTKDFWRDPELRFFFLWWFVIVSVGIYLPFLLTLPFVVEEHWNFDTRSGKVNYRRLSLIFKSEGSFSINLIEKMQFYGLYLDIYWKDLTKNKTIKSSIPFKKMEDREKVMGFLENATGLKAEKTYDD